MAPKFLGRWAKKAMDKIAVDTQFPVSKIPGIGVALKQ